MKKVVKNLLVGLIICVSFFFYTPKVQANSIENIDMDVYLNKEGNAHVKTIWQASLNQGTEGYLSFSKLGNSKISNFIVTDDTGRTYSFIEDWNTSASFQNKAYKNGYHHISNGVELCFGISQYGNRTYTLEYDISNLVTAYSDVQGTLF